jgi:hypothetical protein
MFLAWVKKLKKYPILLSVEQKMRKIYNFVQIFIARSMFSVVKVPSKFILEGFLGCQSAMLTTAAFRSLVKVQRVVVMSPRV